VGHPVYADNFKDDMALWDNVFPFEHRGHLTTGAVSSHLAIKD